MVPKALARLTREDLIRLFEIDPHALRYFGIIRFLDLPGHFPALSVTNGRGKEYENVETS
jgi:hypothetical protein